MGICVRELGTAAMRRDSKIISKRALSDDLDGLVSDAPIQRRQFHAVQLGQISQVTSLNRSWKFIDEFLDFLGCDLPFRHSHRVPSTPADDTDFRRDRFWFLEPDQDETPIAIRLNRHNVPFAQAGLAASLGGDHHLPATVNGGIHKHSKS
jgi:hypothetical protein